MIFPKKKILIILFFLSVLCTLYPAQSFSAFEDLSLSARSAGMAGAYTGLSDDAGSMFFNPSGMISLKRPEVLGSFILSFPGSVNNVGGYGGFVYPTQNAGCFGVGIFGRGLSKGAERYNETNFGLSYARKMDSNISWGITIKNCAQGDSYSDLVFFKNRFVSGFSADLGLMYKIPKVEKLNMGIGVNDLGAGIFSFRLGAGYKTGEVLKVLENSIASADFVMRGDGEMKINVGAEGWFKPTEKLKQALQENLLGVRAGVKFGTSGDFSLALGIGIKSNNIERTDWKFDVAVIPVYHTASGFSGGSYIASCSLLLGDANKWEKDEILRKAEQERIAKLTKEKDLLTEENKRLAAEKQKLEDEKRLLEEARAKAMEELKKLQGITVRDEGEKIVIVASENAINFASGSADIMSKSYGTLDKIGKALKAYPDSIISIEGHTDNVPIGKKLKSKYTNNSELSQARAESVAQYFADQNISQSRLLKKGYGDSKPAASNATAEGKAKNRRVEIIIQK